jgi:hypothetical protein
LGLTPAGLRENGWAIAPDEVDERRQEKAATEDKPKEAPKRRLRAVGDDG